MFCFLTKINLRLNFPCVSALLQDAISQLCSRISLTDQRREARLQALQRRPKRATEDDGTTHTDYTECVYECMQVRKGSRTAGDPYSAKKYYTSGRRRPHPPNVSPPYLSLPQRQASARFYRTQLGLFL